MAQKKQPYNWNKVTPGDIISFRYKSKTTKKTLVNSVLVLNPKLPVRRKDGSSTFHLIGIKLEESNKISLRLNQRQYRTYDWKTATKVAVFLEPIRLFTEET